MITQGKRLNLKTNCLNYFFKEMFGDQSRKFVDFFKVFTPLFISEDFLYSPLSLE